MRFFAIHLQDFQVHGNTKVEFGPGITTIRGPTDAGKSAILRALRWVAQNHLSGEGFIQEGSKQTTVTLETREKGQITTIIREKSLGGTRNTYQMDAEVFKSFAQGVPADISQALRVADLNFQDQYDSPFWFRETAGEVSRQLNSIVDLSVIDSSLTAIAGTVRSINEKRIFIEERLQEAKKEHTVLKAQEDRIVEFKKLKKEHERINQSQANVRALDDLIARLHSRKSRATSEEEKAKDGEAVVVRGSHTLLLKRQCEKLSGILDSARQHEQYLPPPPFDSVENAFQKQANRSAAVVSLSGLIDRIVASERNLALLDETAKESEARLHQKMKGQQCPLCGSNL